MSISLNIKTLISVVALAALTACGGGGSSSSLPGGSADSSQSGGSSGGSSTGGGSTSGGSGFDGPVQEPVYFTDTVEPNALVASSYEDSNRTLAYDRFNEVRLAAGLGAVRQQAQLDVAAQGHADWMVTNNTVGHYQILNTPGFTGYDPFGRAYNAGYFKLVTENVSFAPASNLADTHVDMLMAAPYHRLAMLYYRIDEVGIGYRVDYPSTLVIKMGRNPGQGAPSTLAVAWPVDGAVDVKVSGEAEVPDPIPENNGSDYGQPVSISTHELKKLTVESFTLEDEFGNTVSTKLLTYATDSNLRFYNANHFASLIPRSPLQAGTKYVAKFVGKIDATPYTKTWSFTTGSSGF